MVINKKVLDEFNKQINEEIFSSYLYLSMAAHFDTINLKGFSHWLKVQAKEEMTHAMKFYNHIVERGGKVTLTAITAPKTSWKEPLDAFTDAYNHECHITGRINFS